MKFWQKNKTKILFGGLILILNFLLLRNVWGWQTFFPTHDDTWIVRLQQFDKAIRLGQIPPCLCPDVAFGYGYPLFCFYAPLFTFINWIFYKIVGSLSLAILISLFSIGAIGSWGMNRLAGYLWRSKWAGALAAIVYLFLPYRALDLFVRGAFSEYLALAVLPWLWYFSFKFLAHPKNKKIWLGLVVSVSLFILSHNLYLIMLFYFLPVLAILFSRYRSKKVIIKNLSLALILILSLTAFFWLPLLARLKDIVVLNQAQTTNFADHFVFLNQLWYSPWGFGGSASGQKDGMSFALGKINILLFAVGLIGLFLKSQKIKEKISLLAIGLGSLFLSLPMSGFLWRRLPFLSMVQFPWRFLGYFSLVLAFGASGTMTVLEKIIGYFKIKRVNLMLLIGFLVLTSILFIVQIKLFQPQMVIQNNEEYFLSLEKIREETVEHMPEYWPRGVEKKPQVYSGKAFVEQEEMNIEVALNSPFQINFRVGEIEQEENLVVNRFYFPGWHLYHNNSRESVLLHPLDGKFSFIVSEPGFYHLRFTRLWYENFAFAFSSLALAILFVVVIF